MISEFLSGVVTVSVLIILGCLLALVFKWLLSKYPFTRLALVLALTPLSLINFMDRDGVSSLYLYAMIVVLLGITIDGINHLLRSKPEQEEAAEERAETAERKPAKEKAEPVAGPGVIVWEKAE